MNKFMAKLKRFGKIRQLHTIMSQETIRPTSPTPLHLKTHNLSLCDQFIAPDFHMPFVFFYSNYKKGDTNLLKQSLSQCLTQYYHLAGRISTPPVPYVNCNDEGVEFIEAFNDSQLDDFIHISEEDKTLDQLFPYGLSSSPRAACPKLLEIQLNHFAGGGAAVAVSMSHKVADAATMSNFINHWASVARCESPENPSIISSSTTKNIDLPKLIYKEVDKVNYVNRRFVFPNSKLKELKNKITAMGAALTNPSRVEVLTSFLYKHTVTAAIKKSGTLKVSHLCVAMNLRNKLVKNNPETAAGNFVGLAITKMADFGEIKLSEVIAKAREAKMEFEGIREEQKVVENWLNTYSALQGDVYYTSSLCRVPFYEADFGWGKPVEVRIRIPNMNVNFMFLMDTPSRDGITGHLHLPQEEIEILQKDKEFLTYIKDV